MKYTPHFESLNDLLDKYEAARDAHAELSDTLPEKGVLIAEVELPYGQLPTIDANTLETAQGISLHVTYQATENHPEIPLYINLNNKGTSYVAVVDAKQDENDFSIPALTTGGKMSQPLSAIRRDMTRGFIVQTGSGGLRMVCDPKKFVGEKADYVLEYQMTASQLSLEEKWYYLHDVLQGYFGQKDIYCGYTNVTDDVIGGKLGNDDRLYRSLETVTDAHDDLLAVNKERMPHDQIRLYGEFVPVLEKIVRSLLHDERGKPHVTRVHRQIGTLYEMMGTQETTSFTPRQGLSRFPECGTTTREMTHTVSPHAIGKLVASAHKFADKYMNGGKNPHHEAHTFLRIGKVCEAMADVVLYGYSQGDSKKPLEANKKLAERFSQAGERLMKAAEKTLKQQ